MLHYANTSHMPLRVYYLDSYLFAESLDQVLAYSLSYTPFNILIKVVRVKPIVWNYIGLVFVILLLSLARSYLSSLSYLNYYRSPWIVSLAVNEW